MWPILGGSFWWGLFSFKGRMGRGGWWAWSVICWSVHISVLIVVGNLVRLAGLGQSDVLAWIVVALWVFLFTWSRLAVAAKRWHDLDHTGLWSMAWLVPILGLAIYVALGFVPGSSEANRYGPGPG